MEDFAPRYEEFMRISQRDFLVFTDSNTKLLHNRRHANQAKDRIHHIHAYRNGVVYTVDIATERRVKKTVVLLRQMVFFILLGFPCEKDCYVGVAL